AVGCGSRAAGRSAVAVCACPPCEQRHDLALERVDVVELAQRFELRLVEQHRGDLQQLGATAQLDALATALATALVTALFADDPEKLALHEHLPAEDRHDPLAQPRHLAIALG